MKINENTTEITVGTIGKNDTVVAIYRRILNEVRLYPLDIFRSEEFVLQMLAEYNMTPYKIVELLTLKENNGSISLYSIVNDSGDTVELMDAESVQRMLKTRNSNKGLMQFSEKRDSEIAHKIMSCLTSGKKNKKEREKQRIVEDNKCNDLQVSIDELEKHYVIRSKEDNGQLRGVTYYSIKRFLLEESVHNTSTKTILQMLIEHSGCIKLAVPGYGYTEYDLIRR